MAETATEEKSGSEGAQSVEFSESGAGAAVGPGSSIDILLDMHVPVTAAVGKRDIPARRLLQLGVGSVLKLDKSIDAPIDLYLKENKFATGSIVVVDGCFAVKIKEVMGISMDSSAGGQDADIENA